MTEATNCEELVDCPRCEGWGYFLNDKLCMCLLEQSQGWTPGKLPVSMAEKLTPRKRDEVK